MPPVRFPTNRVRNRQFRVMAAGGASRLSQSWVAICHCVAPHGPHCQSIERSTTGTHIRPALVNRRWFADEHATIEKLEADVAALQQQMEEMAEEHGGEEGAAR